MIAVHLHRLRKDAYRGAKTVTKKLVLRILVVPSAFLAVAAIPSVLIAGMFGALWVLVASYWVAALLAWHLFEGELRAAFSKRR